MKKPGSAGFFFGHRSRCPFVVDTAALSNRQSFRVDRANQPHFLSMVADVPRHAAIAAEGAARSPSAFIPLSRGDAVLRTSTRESVTKKGAIACETFNG
jgi:hypothetical protein